MMQKKENTLRRTVDIDEMLDIEIKSMAEKRGWSFSKMAYVLLQYAVKEKTRRNKGEGHFKYHTSNPCSCYSGRQGFFSYIPKPVTSWWVEKITPA